MVEHYIFKRVAEIVPVMASKATYPTDKVWEVGLNPFKSSSYLWSYDSMFPHKKLRGVRPLTGIRPSALGDLAT